MQFNALIADDQINDLDDIVHKIETSIKNININKADTVDEILSKIHDIDILILSSTFKNNESYDLVKSICNNKLNIIFLTNDANADEEINKACEVGVYDFISKPINFSKIVSKIKHYMTIHNREIELQKEKRISTYIMNTTVNPIFITDSNQITFANKIFLDLLGFDSSKELNKTFEDINDLFITNSEAKDNYKNILGNNLNSNWLNNIKNNNEHKLCIVNKEGIEFTYIPTSTLLDDGFTYIIHLKDITKEIEHQTQLTNLLYTDTLTALPNRTKLIDDLQNAKLDIKSLSILDINSFKEINDFYGYRTGDAVLNNISQLVSSIISKYHNLVLYKLPADTYCITNSNINEKEFTSIVKEIIDAIDKKVFHINQHEVDSTVTAGISFSTKNNKLITADLALQAAKKGHDNYLVFYDELDNLNEYKNNMEWTKKLKNALANDDIIVYYQPLINNKTLKVDKYECLVRMIDGDKVISPFFFLDISKKSNQYSKITKVVIEKSFKEFSTLPFEFSVNVSYEDIEAPSFLGFIKKELKKYDIASRVVFEILEDENIKNYDILINFIKEVKALGCKVAIDDFGSGYSNFEHLLKMDIDFLKIDASLIKNIAKDQNSYKVTKTIIEFAKSLNLKTIAEFVENEDIFNIVKELGTDYSQGYYFSAPVSVPNIYKCK